MSDDVLRAEHESIQRAVLSSRKAFAISPLGAFARAMMDAMTEYHTARAAGVSRDDACKGLEAVLRDVWPKPTTKFPPACSDCEGTGWREVTCWHERRCARPRCAGAHPSFEHLYVVPCDCPTGDTRKPRVFTSDDAQLAAVGRTRKKRSSGGFSRF